jgi:glutamate racemase
MSWSGGSWGQRKKQVSNFVPEKENDVTVIACKTNSTAVKY